MKKLVFIVITAASICVVSGATNEVNAVNGHKQAKKGCWITRPAMGKIAILNCQNRVSEDKLKGRAEILSSMLCSRPVVEKVEGFSVDSAPALMAKHKANIAFFMIDNPTLPMSLVSLEDAWAMMNIAKIAENCPNDKVLVRRMNTEFNRIVHSLLCVGEGAANVVPRNGAGLDTINSIGISVQAAVAIHNSMIKYGIREERRVPYMKACREGWAPAPTNEVQKAIWDKIHTIPTEPITIQPETKKVER